MTDLWYIKRNDCLRFETLKCSAVVLKFYYLLLGPLRTSYKFCVHSGLKRTVFEH